MQGQGIMPLAAMHAAAQSNALIQLVFFCPY
jgi:hypothetical protein